ncbi:energy transducer TonB [Sphingomonas sp. HITSZ_GF]|uniref:energy transducer TonB n=1 Tax=Sphingomonas sp. HITSZ_GF TaxID=3037247 RepID=UPI00240E048C|nr:energy transducer TonB [Sphingomonas sp. HITSZ_GF]MDG2533925.1 energy transducer TonB [Sphingomonas sp. HITSZ_GF]
MVTPRPRRRTSPCFMGWGMTMRTWLLAPALAVVSLFSGSAAWAQAKPIETVKRTGQWVVNFDDDSCELIGTFGPAEDRTLLRFSRFSLSDSLDIAVLGNRVNSRTPWLKVKLDFGGNAKPIERQAGGGSLGTYPAIFVTNVRLDGWQDNDENDAEAPPITAEQEAAVTGMQVAVEGKKPFRLEFGPLDKPMIVMRQCLDNLVRHWGYDPAALKGLTRPLKPVSNPGTWFNGVDFPSEAQSAGHNGLLRFRLDIDEKGAVAGCHILTRSKPDEFSVPTCKRLTARGRFRPALDSSGQPIRAFYLGSISWKA